MQRVEGVEKLFLCPFFSGQELDVIDEQDVDAPVLGAELQGPVVADGVDQFVRKLLAADVGDAV